MYLGTKDADYCKVYDMAGMSRMIICPADYEFFSGREDANIIGLYYFNVEDVNGFVRGFDAEGFVTSMNSITKSTYTMAYSFDMIMAGLLILIGICLILIALLVLRFTLVFTIEEEYREIGIMKAIGLKSFAIKKPYFKRGKLWQAGGASPVPQKTDAGGAVSRIQ